MSEEQIKVEFEKECSRYVDKGYIPVGAPFFHEGKMQQALYKKH